MGHIKLLVIKLLLMKCSTSVACAVRLLVTNECIRLSLVGSRTFSSRISYPDGLNLSKWTKEFLQIFLSVLRGEVLNKQVALFLRVLKAGRLECYLSASLIRWNGWLDVNFDSRLYLVVMKILDCFLSASASI